MVSKELRQKSPEKTSRRNLGLSPVSTIRPSHAARQQIRTPRTNSVRRRTPGTRAGVQTGSPGTEIPIPPRLQPVGGKLHRAPERQSSSKFRPRRQAKAGKSSQVLQLQ